MSKIESSINRINNANQVTLHMSLRPWLGAYIGASQKAGSILATLVCPSSGLHQSEGLRLKCRGVHMIWDGIDFRLASGRSA